MASGFAHVIGGWSGKVTLFGTGGFAVHEVYADPVDSVIGVCRKIATAGLGLFGGSWSVYATGDGIVTIASDGALPGWGLVADGVLLDRTKLPDTPASGPVISGTEAHDDGLYLTPDFGTLRAGLTFTGADAASGDGMPTASAQGTGGVAFRTTTGHQVTVYAPIGDLYALEEQIVGTWDLWTPDPLRIPRMFFTGWTRSPVRGKRDPGFMVATSNGTAVL